MVNTFTPPPNAHGENGPEYVGNLRRGELRGVIKINKDNCVGCDTCRKVCPVHAISGGLGVVHSIREDACLSCGQCLIACPFNAIEQMSFVDEVMKMLDDPKKLVVAHPSPAVRVSVGEEFGAKAGELVTEQFVNALEKAGFTTYDVNQTADQTIMEEGFEFINKIRYWVLGERGPELEEAAKHPFPHFTSCCPAWVKNVETFHPGLLPHLSTAKSPIQMGGPIAKTWAAEYVWKKDPRDIYVVAVTLIAWLKGKEYNFKRFAIVGVCIGLPVIDVLGCIQLKLITGMTWEGAVLSGVLPFIPLDIVKCLGAAALARPLYKILGAMR